MAVLVIVPRLAESTRAAMTRVGVAHGATVPIGQMTVPLLPAGGVTHGPPWLRVAETNVTSTGSVSVMVTDFAVDGPALPTVRVYVSMAPALTGSGVSVIASPTSARGVRRSVS